MMVVVVGVSFHDKYDKDDCARNINITFSND